MTNNKKPLNIMFGDFGYFNRHTRYSRYTPLGVGYIAQYAKQKFGKDIDVAIYKEIDKLSVEEGTKGDDVRRFLNEIDTLTSAHFAATGNQPSPQDFKDIVTSLMTDLVWDSNLGQDTQGPLILSMDDAEDLYIKVERLDNSGKTDNVQLSEIKDVDRAMFISVLNNNNIPVTAQGVAELSTVPPAEITDIVKAMERLNYPVSIKAIREFYINNLGK